jgi:hypothetical protein
MSGGSYNYAFRHVEEFADKLDGNVPLETSFVLRKAFGTHCRMVARAMKAIEWNDSDDGDDQEEQLIKAVLAPREQLVKAARDVLRALGAE